MAKLKAISGGKGKGKPFALVYGLRLYPAGVVAQLSEGMTLQQNGSESRVPLHLIEGTREQIRAQLLASIDAFFDIYDGESEHIVASSYAIGGEVEEPGC
ncbi:MAG: hypothetical protein AB7P69_29770 [Candidatus Binatia bacterium]